MGILDIFDRDKDGKVLDDIGEAAKRIVKPAASFAAETILPGAKFIKSATSEPVQDVVKPIASKINEKVVVPAAEWLNKVDDVASGAVKRDDGQPMLVEDLPAVQQAAGALFHTFKNVGSGITGSTESAMRGFQWLGVDEAKPLADKLSDWQRAVAPENPEFVDKLGAGLGSAITFFAPGIGVEKAALMIGKLSPRIASIFGNSAMTAFEALTEAGDSYQTAINDGKNTKQASDTATKVFWANAALIGLTNKLGYFNNNISSKIKKILISSPLEGLQEFGQQVIQNVTSGRTWDEGAYEAGAIGTLLGGILGGSQEIGMDPLKQKTAPSSDDRNPAIAAIPEEAYSVETGTETKYFQTEQEAKSYSASLPDGTYTINKKNAEQNAEIISAGGFSAFPFEGSTSVSQQSIDNAIANIQENTGLPKNKAVEMFMLMKSFAESQAAGAKRPEIFNEAIDMAKGNIGEMPDIMQQAIAEAQKQSGIEIAKPEEQVSGEMFHMTNVDADIIKDSGFRPGKNSVFGEAAFFGSQENRVYGDNKIAVKRSNYNLKRFDTVKEQQEYVAKQGTKKLADAVRKEGKYDGFIIPNKEIGDIIGVTNKEKLDSEMKSQQMVTTEEARKTSKSFRFIEELGLPVVAQNKILTPNGELAYGKYFNAVISFIENPHKTTIPHEALHAYMDLMLTKSEKKAIIEEVKRRYAGKKLTDQQAEEQLADDFAKYYIKKKENEKTAKAPSNKLKQFYDWFIEQISKLVGKGDILDRLYRDIQTKKPGVFQKRLIRERIKRGIGSMEELQKEYFQNPDGLSTKFLENVDVKNREVSSYQFLKNLLKSKSLPLKEIERNLIDDILDTQFKDEKKINMEQFRAAVRSELMPLQVIESDSYADYGMENLQMEDMDASTHIYNSPFNHGYTGHFSGDFRLEIKADEIEIRQIPGQEKWAVIRSGAELTEENIAENVYHVASTEEAARNWVETRTLGKDAADGAYVDVGRKGLFGHVRVWDDKNNYRSSDSVDGIRYIAEIQSDSFQKQEHLAGITKEINFYKSEVKYIEEDIITRQSTIDRWAEIPQSIKSKTGTLTSKKKDLAKLKESLIEKRNKILELEKELDSEKNKAEKQFFQFKNTWHERLIREEIRRAAMEGKTKLRFPTPFTLSKIEGYLGDDGQIPTGTEIGDTFSYMGDPYVLLTNQYDEAGKATPNGNVRGTFDFYTLRDEEVSNAIDEIQDAVNNSESFSDFTDNYYTGNITSETIDKINKEFEETKTLSPNTVEELAGEVIDRRYEDADGFVEWYNENVEPDYAFAKGNDEIIFLKDNNRVETLSFGVTEGAKDDFNYEEDLNADEHKTVARFYDKQVNRYLAKLRKQNWRLVSDDNGNDWYETDILPEDRVAVEAFQTKPAEEPMKRSGKEVADYVSEIEAEKDNDDLEVFEEMLRPVIEGQDFELTSIKIKDLIDRDKVLEDYVNAGKNRYDPSDKDLSDLPVVAGNWQGDWGVIDGYNRILTAVQQGKEYIEAFINAKDMPALSGEKLLKRLKGGKMGYKDELRKWGIPPVGSTYGAADVATIDGKPAVAMSWSDDEVLAGFAIHPDFQRRGLGLALIRRIAEQTGSLDVYDPNERMMGLLKKLGDVSEPDGYGIVTLTLNPQPKFQKMDDDERFRREMRRGEIMDLIERNAAEQEEKIIAARTVDLSYADGEKENGYQNFKKLASRRPWVLQPDTDDARLKLRLPAMNIDNYLFSGASDMQNDEMLDMFKDRYFQEQEMAITAKLPTPSEIDAANKRVAQRIVKEETIGRKPTIKNAINVAIGVEKPKQVTMREDVLLKKKLRDIARGVKWGRADMRAIMIDTFRTKQEDIASIKKAIIGYASDLPANEKAKLLPLVANATSQRDLAKAFARLDAVAQRVDKIEELEKLKDTISGVKKAMRTGRGIAVDYQKKISEILEDYDLRTPTKKTMAKLQSLKQYADENPGFVPDHILKRLERLSRKNPAQMSAAEIKELNDTLSRLVALGHLKLQLKNNYDERVREANLKLLISSTNNQDPKGDPKDIGYAAKEAKKRMYLHTLHSFRVTDQIDGFLDYKGQNTRLQRAVAHKVNNAELSSDSLLRRVYEEIRAIKNDWTEEEQEIMEFHLLIDQGANTQANELANAKGWKEIPELTPEMAAAMDIMRGAFAQTEDYLAAVYEEINNKPFEKVENYFPLKYEQRKGEIPEPTIGQKVIRSSKTEQGFTITRLPNVKRTPRTDVFAQFEEAIREQQYFMQVQPILLEVQRLVNDSAYKDVAGSVVTNWWRDYIDAMSNRGQMSGVRSNAWLRNKRIQLSRAILGYKLSSFMMQPMAIFDAVSYVQLRYGQIPAARLLLHFANTWINPFYAKKVVSQSPSLTLRKGNAGDLAIEEIRQESRGQRVMGAFNRAAFVPLQWADIKTAASVNRAIYKILRGKKVPEDQAQSDADLIMNIVSGSSEVADRPMVLMRGEEMRAIFTFQTFMLNRWGLIIHDIIRSGLIRGSLGRKAKSIYALFILALAGGVENEVRKKIYQAVTGKEINDKLSFWQNGFVSIPEAIPILGQIIRSYTQYGQGMSIPILTVIDNFRLGTQEMVSDDPEKRLKGFLRVGEAVATWNGLAGSAQLGDIAGRMFLEDSAPQKGNIDVDLPDIPEIEVPDIMLPELPALPDLNI